MIDAPFPSTFECVSSKLARRVETSLDRMLKLALIPDIASIVRVRPRNRENPGEQRLKKQNGEMPEDVGVGRMPQEGSTSREDLTSQRGSRNN